MNQNDAWMNEARQHREKSIKSRKVWEEHNLQVRVLVTKLHNVGGLSYYKIAQGTGYSERWVKSMCITENAPDVVRHRASKETREPTGAPYL